jgi:hypothetical protein
MSLAPTTMLRMVPLPRFAREELPASPFVSSPAAQRRGRGTARSAVERAGA